MDLYKMTAHQLSDMLKNKEVSSTDITKSVIDRITSVDDKVKSYITVTADKALETAKAVDEKIAKGEEIAPLEGIPAGIKDNICTEGINTTCASKMLENFVPPYDAFVTKKLKAINTPVLGKLNMDEFAMGSSTEAILSTTDFVISVLLTSLFLSISESWWAVILYKSIFISSLFHNFRNAVTA